MRQTDVIAILMADLHFCQNAPIARSLEEDWIERQGTYCDQIRMLAEEHHCPVICAGDVFDRWNAPAEVVNMVLGRMPVFYSVCGQHDLPMHNYQDIRKSSYWTLVEARKIIHLHPGKPVEVGSIRLHGFPWGHVPVPLIDKNGLLEEIAVIHRYLWVPDKGYPGAPEEYRLGKTLPSLSGYDYAVFGDNHIPFRSDSSTGTKVVNCGSLMRRSIDQRDYRPRVWFLRSSGELSPHYIDTSTDSFTDTHRELKGSKINGQPIGDFLAKLKNMDDICISFEEAVRRLLDRTDIKEDVKKIVLAAVKESRGDKE